MATTSVNTDTTSEGSTESSGTSESGGMFGDISTDSFMGFVKNPLGMALVIGIVLTISVYLIV